MSHRVTSWLSLTVVFVLAACSDPSHGPVSTGVDDAQLTILNALVDANPLSTITLDGENLLLPSAGNARGLAIDGGAHRLEAIDSGGHIIAHADFDVGSGGRRTAIVTGASSGVLLLVASDTASLPAAGTSKIRVVHMAEGTSLLDAYLYQAYATPDSSSLIMGSISYGAGNGNEFPNYFVRPPAAYRVRITAGGSSYPLVESPIFHTLSGQIWSIVLIRSSTGALILQPIRER